MRACTMANGAVFFAPDEIERKTNSISYAEIAAGEEPIEEKPARRFFFFGPRKKTVPMSDKTPEGRERLTG